MTKICDFSFEIDDSLLKYPKFIALDDTIIKLIKRLNYYEELKRITPEPEWQMFVPMHVHAYVEYTTYHERKYGKIHPHPDQDQKLPYCWKCSENCHLIKEMHIY